MKNYLLLLLVLANYYVFAQAPAIQWNKTIGGAGVDALRVIKQTSDGGFIMGGSSSSNSSGDKSENSKGGDDYWVVKLDANGNKIWDKTIGGADGDAFVSLQQTTDGGYILGGHSFSNISGDKSENSKGGVGSNDYWVVKLDANGNKIWDKTIGGNLYEYLGFLQQTADGGYILGGDSYSDISGDKSENSKGAYDYWVVKLDVNGNKIWDKTIGGADFDHLRSLQQTADDGYILAGDSKSDISGDKSEVNKGLEDYWMVKLDANGNKIWDKTIGGANFDNLYSLLQTADGGYILGGESYSDISGDKSENRKGSTDMWVVKLDANGIKIWDKTIGGNDQDNLQSMQKTADNGYIMGGFSFSNISGDKTENSKGLTDYWVVKLDANGNKIWDKTIGGASGEGLNSLLQTPDNGYILGGTSSSNVSGDKTENSKGLNDYWVVKLDTETVNNCSASTLSVTIPNAYAINPGGNINTVYIGYQPASSITLISTPSGGNGPYNYSWSTAPSQTTQQITVSPSVAGSHEYTVTVTDASGCTAEFTKTITAVDIRSGQNKIYICHKDNKGKRNTLSVNASSVADHLAHGDYLGTCVAPANNKMSSENITTMAYGKELTAANSSLKKITIGPNPNNGNFFFSVNGIEKETVATLYTIDGRQIKQFKVMDLQQQKVNGMPTGMYLLRIPGFETQKIIVSGNGNIAPQTIQSNYNKF